MPKKSTKKVEQSKKSEKEIKSDYHWSKLRSKEKDTSKRVLPDTILPGTRQRTNYNYNLSAMAKNNVDDEKVVKRRPSNSVNTLEQREKLAKVAKKKSGSSKDTVEQRRRRKPTKKDQKQEEEEEPTTVVAKANKTNNKKAPANNKRSRQEREQDDEEEHVSGTEEDEQPKAKKAAVSKKQGEPLSKKVLDLAEKLGAKASTKNNIRLYANKYEEPLAISTFNNLKWPKVCFACDKHNFGGMELMELDLAERNEYKFLRDPKTIIIGSGDVILAAKLDDLSSDFNVYILDDEQKEKFEGPVKISELLKEMTVDEEVDGAE